MGTLVFAQLALAAHACQAMLGGPEARDKVDYRLPADPSSEESTQPIPCAGHCEFGQQNADAKSVLAPTIALVAGNFSLAPHSQGAGAGMPFASRLALPRSAAPPHAILHCCLRN